MIKKNRIKKPSNKTNETKARQVSSRTGIERMFKILGFLQNGHIHKKPVNATTIGQEFEVNRSTVMRDLAFLRNRLGVEFVWDAEENAYLLVGDINFLPSMELNDMDRLVLEYISQSLGALVDTELGREMQKSFEGLVSIFTGKPPKTDWGVQAKFPSKDCSETTMELKIFHMAQRAMRSEVSLKVCMKKDGMAESETLEVKPRSVVFADGKWVLDALAVGDWKPVRLAFGSVLHIELVKENARTVVRPTDAFPVQHFHFIPAWKGADWSNAPLKAA